MVSVKLTSNEAYNSNGEIITLSPKELAAYHRTIAGIKYNRAGKQMSRHGSNYSNNDFYSYADKIMFRDTLIPTYLAYMGTKRNLWDSFSAKDEIAIKSIWEVTLPNLKWKIYSKLCKELVSKHEVIITTYLPILQVTQRLYEWHCKFASKANQIVSAYMFTTFNEHSRSVKAGFVKEALEEDVKYGMKFLWDEYGSRFFKPAEKSGSNASTQKVSFSLIHCAKTS